MGLYAAQYHSRTPIASPIRSGRVGGAPFLPGDADGLPPLPPGLTPQVWEETLLAAYDDFCQQVDEAEQRGQAPLLDPYAAESPAEFFAVMSETFFEIPELLKKEYSELYTLLSRFYRQDPDKRQ